MDGDLRSSRQRWSRSFRRGGAATRHRVQDIRRAAGDVDRYWNLRLDLLAATPDERERDGHERDRGRHRRWCSPLRGLRADPEVVARHRHPLRVGLRPGLRLRPRPQCEWSRARPTHGSGAALWRKRWDRGFYPGPDAVPVGERVPAHEGWPERELYEPVTRTWRGEDRRGIMKLGATKR